MRTLIGPMIYPDGTPMAGVTFMLRAVRLNWSTDGAVPQGIEHRFTTDHNGDFVVSVAQGDWQVWYEMPNTFGAQEILGPLVVEDGSTISLGELLELSRDKTADYSIAADWADKAWVIAQITMGATPYDVAIDALNPGLGTAGQLYRVTGDGLNVEPFTFQLKDYAIGIAGAYGVMYRKPDGKPGLLPVPRTISDDTVAVLGDKILILMDDASGDIDITLPPMNSEAEPSIALIVSSSTYVLPYNINLLRDAGQTFNAVDDDLVISRRRSLVLHPNDDDNWSFS